MGRSSLEPVYFVATVSENTEHQVIDYIKKQKEK